MSNLPNYDFCNEAYEVVKTVILVIEIAGEYQTIKIEALLSLKDGHYCTRAYRKENVTLQPTYPKTNAMFDKKLTDMAVWVSYDLPWTHYKSAEMVISMAISFLRERCRSCT